MSSKNILQEYFQKKGLAIPLYTHLNIQGTNLEPIFQCNVTLHDRTSFLGQPASSKKQAEQNAALIALNFLEKQSLSLQFDFPSNVSLWIDGDNRPLVLEDILKKFRKSDNMKNIHVVYKSGNNFFTNRDYSPMKFYPVSGGIRDTTDFGLAMLLSREMMKEMNKKFYIITSDHFGYAIVEFCKQYYRLTNITCVDNIDNI